MSSTISKSCGNTFELLKSWAAQQGSGFVPLVLLSLVFANVLLFFAGYEQTVTLSDFSDHPFRVLGAMFSHASFPHLAGNMTFLLFTGVQTEKRLGHVRFLLYYLICGVGSSLGFAILFPSAQLLGASGAIAGIIAISPFCQEHVLTLLVYGLAVSVYFVDQFITMAHQFQGTVLSPIANLAHVAGGVVGILLYTFYAHDNK